MFLAAYSRHGMSFLLEKRTGAGTHHWAVVVPVRDRKLPQVSTTRGVAPGPVARHNEEARRRSRGGERREGDARGRSTGGVARGGRGEWVGEDVDAGGALVADQDGHEVPEPAARRGAHANVRLVGELRDDLREGRDVSD